MARMVRALTNTDKILMAAALLNVGVKARIKKLHLGYRVVITAGDKDQAIRAINEEGFRDAAGFPFIDRSFQGDQLFVRYAA